MQFDAKRLGPDLLGGSLVVSGRPRPFDYDVIVVGLGPAGARAAAAASRGGARVLALDRKRVAGEPVQCAELVPALIGPEVVKFTAYGGQAVRCMTTTVEHEAADETAPFPGHVIDRAAFDRAQVELAADAGADCLLASPVRRIDRSLVELADGTRYTSGVLIGADGPRSQVGRSIGQGNRDLVYARQISVPLGAPSDATDIFLSYRIPGGYGWLFPKGARAHVGVGVDACARAQLRPLLDRLHRRLVAGGRVGREVLATSGGAIPVGGQLRPYAAEQHALTLLAGDAAGLTNPVTGAGIHAALVSGELAGLAALDWLAGEADAGTQYALELDDYFGASIRRAALRRRELLAERARGRIRPCALRRGWIAYPQYWHERADDRTSVQETADELF